MRRGLIAAAALTGLAVAVVPAYAGERADPRVVSGGMAGVVHVKGYAGKPGGNPNLVYHGGGVRNGSTFVQPIYWGSSWRSTDEQVTVLQSFYGGLGGSKYAGTNGEYTDSAGHAVNTTNITVASAADIDNASAPSKPSTGAVLTEVANALTANNQTPVPNGYYPVYIDQPRGHASYCAWHSAGTINGVSVTFGFFFKLDNDPGCDPNSPVTTYGEGTAAAANVSGHEISEMLTDPQLNAWYDTSGAENADKCAWKFSGNLLTFGGKSWRIQGNWSNNAYNTNKGYVRGCIDGS